jgi:hypothetical protein
MGWFCCKVALAAVLLLFIKAGYSCIYETTIAMCEADAAKTYSECYVPKKMEYDDKVRIYKELALQAENAYLYAAQARMARMVEILKISAAAAETFVRSERALETAAQDPISKMVTPDVSCGHLLSNCTTTSRHWKYTIRAIGVIEFAEACFTFVTENPGVVSSLGGLVTAIAYFIKSVEAGAGFLKSIFGSAMHGLKYRLAYNLYTVKQQHYDQTASTNRMAVMLGQKNDKTDMELPMPPSLIDESKMPQPTAPKATPQSKRAIYAALRSTYE